MTPFGVYVHIPFCTRRCDYCAFATWSDRAHLRGAYVAGLVTELRRAQPQPASSVYLGGGTPSLLDGEEMAAILDAVPRQPGAEITVECNPDHVTEPLMSAYVAAGVNRVSLGVQSLVDRVLDSLGREHRRRQITDAVAAIRAAGVERYSFDLIYGAAGERLEDWAESVHGALALGPTHVSAYALTVEAGTPLAADPDRHPDDDDLADKYELADRAFAAAGLANYEISNWAVPGDECRHNLLYWEQGNYLGVGCAAHSHRDGRRWWNLRTPERYLAAIAAGESTEAAAEVLDAGTRRAEGLALQLRLRDGVAAEAIDTTGLDGLVVTDGGRVRLTRAGRLLANEVSLRLR